MFSKSFNVTIFGALRIAQMTAKFSRRRPLPSKRDRGELPRRINLRRGVGNCVRCRCRHVAGPAGQPFGPDPAFACVHSHAVHRTRPIRQALPTGLVAVTDMTIGAAGMQKGLCHGGKDLSARVLCGHSTC